MHTPFRNSWKTAAATLLGAGLLFASAGIHLDLYLTGYRSIPTIGWLFLVQTVATILVGLSVLVSDHLIVRLNGALLAVGTIAGYTLSRAVGLFGFHELATTAGLVAGLIEVGAFVTFGALILHQTRAVGQSTEASQSNVSLPGPLARASDLLVHPLVVFVASTVLFGVVLAGGLGSSNQPANNASTTVQTTSGTVIHVVITNFAFKPATVVAKPGETISVRNEDPVAHTLTAVPGSSPQGTFDTGNIDSGQTKSFDAPKVSGSYSFYCSIHNFMTGVLRVTK